MCGSHGYGGLDGAGMELVLGRHAGQSQVVGRMSGYAGAFSECVGNTLTTPDRTSIQVRSSRYGRAGIGRSSWNGLTRNATRRLRFVVRAAGWLHSMVLHGHRNMTAIHTCNRDTAYSTCKTQDADQTPRGYLVKGVQCYDLFGEIAP